MRSALALLVECADGSLTSTGPAFADSLRVATADRSDELALDEQPGSLSNEEQIAELFWTQITTGTPTELSGDQNLPTIRLVDAIQRTSETDAPVEI